MLSGAESVLNVVGRNWQSRKQKQEDVRLMRE